MYIHHPTQVPIHMQKHACMHIDSVQSHGEGQRKILSEEEILIKLQEGIFLVSVSKSTIP